MASKPEPAAVDAAPVIPSPPADFHRRDLPTRLILAGSLLVRCHRSDRNALYFSRGAPGNRFDNPDYGTSYVGLSVEASFVECFCRGTGLTIVHEADLRQRPFSHIIPRRDLMVAELHGPGLMPMGATAAVASGAYAYSKPWGQAIWSHPQRLDGICYASRHDDTQLCVALFDRCHGELTVQSWLGSMMDNPGLLGAILDRYRLALDR